MAIGDFVGKFGSAGTGDGQFQNFANSIRVFTDYIYVSEGNTSNKRIQMFNKTSPYSFVDKFSPASSDPFDVDVDSDYIYIITNVDSKLKIHNKTSPYAQIGVISNIGGAGAYAPVSMLIDSVDSNVIYISCVQNQRIEIYNKISPWNLIGQFGSAGSGDGQFQFASSVGGPNGGIANDSNYIYVADTNNNRVQIFNKTSPYSFVGKFGSIGSGNGQFNTPTGLTVDDLYIYIADKSNNRVQIFNKTSPYSFVGKFGSAGSGNGQFNTLQKIIIDFNGLLYVTDTGNSRVQIFQGQPAFVPGAKGGGGGGAGGGASGRHIKRRYTGRSLGG